MFISLSEYTRVPPFDLLGLSKFSFSKNLNLDIETDGYVFFIILTASPIFIVYQ